MNSKSAELMGQELAAIVKAEIAKAEKPLIARLEALESEVRNGHKRIKALEAMQGGAHG